MEVVIENYILRATAEGKIERFWKANQRRPDRWTEIKGGKTNKGYLQTTLYLPSGRRQVLIHRLVYLAYNQDWDIWDTGKDNVIDHRDGSPINNKIENLQKVTTQQNNFNRHTAKGYSFDKRRGKYHAEIGLDGKSIYLGDHDTAEEARQAYLDAKAIYHII